MQPTRTKLMAAHEHTATNRQTLSITWQNQNWICRTIWPIGPYQLRTVLQINLPIIKSKQGASINQAITEIYLLDISV